MTTHHPVKRATPAEIARVRRYIVTAVGQPSRTAETGMPVRETDTHIIVRLYSAMCLHEEYAIPKAEIIEVQKY